MKKPELPVVAPPAADVPRAPAKAVKVVKPPPPPPLPEDELLYEAPPPGAEPIIGSGDRAHHLALVAGHGTVQLRTVTRPAEKLPRLRPTSRAACERRCGKAGQCDPASPYGCGGEFCQGCAEPPLY